MIKLARNILWRLFYIVCNLSEISEIVAGNFSDIDSSDLYFQGHFIELDVDTQISDGESDVDMKAVIESMRHVILTRKSFILILASIWFLLKLSPLLY
jgi:hypothetical protein